MHYLCCVQIYICDLAYLKSALINIYWSTMQSGKGLTQLRRDQLYSSQNFQISFQVVQVAKLPSLCQGARELSQVLCSDNLFSIMRCVYFSVHYISRSLKLFVCLLGFCFLLSFWVLLTKKKFIFACIDRPYFIRLSFTLTVKIFPLQKERTRETETLHAGLSQ